MKNKFIAENEEEKTKDKLLRLVAENPNLEIKFFIDGELNDEANSWYAGDLTDVEVSDYIEYKEKVYTEFSDVLEEYEEMSEEELKREADIKKVILVRIGVKR